MNCFWTWRLGVGKRNSVLWLALGTRKGSGRQRGALLLWPSLCGGHILGPSVGTHGQPPLSLWSTDRRRPLLYRLVLKDAYCSMCCCFISIDPAAHGLVPQPELIFEGTSQPLARRSIGQHSGARRGPFQTVSSWTESTHVCKAWHHGDGQRNACWCRAQPWLSSAGTCPCAAPTLDRSVRFCYVTRERHKY